MPRREGSDAAFVALVSVLSIWCIYGLVKGDNRDDLAMSLCYDSAARAAQEMDVKVQPIGVPPVGRVLSTRYYAVGRHRNRTIHIIQARTREG